MKTNKTTALIAKLNDTLAYAENHIVRCGIIEVREAIAAFEQPAVREMSIDECMKELEIAYDNEIDSFGGKQYCAPSASKAMALARAKLGTIRVMEG